MSGKSRGGFTIIEVLVAIVILSTGLLAIAAGSGSVFRMLGAGRRSAQAATVAQARTEVLRRIANSTTPRCTALVSGSAVSSNGIGERWLITGSGNTRTVMEVITAPTNRGVTIDTVFARVECY